MLVLDDLHWADRPTLQLLQHLLRGNTTAAIGKGFAIGSAALTALALLAPPLAAQEDIGGGRKLFDQIQLLMDDADARPFGVAGAAKANRFTAEDEAVLEQLRERRDRLKAQLGEDPDS